MQRYGRKRLLAAALWPSTGLRYCHRRDDSLRSLLASLARYARRKLTRTSSHKVPSSDVHIQIAIRRLYGQLVQIETPAV